MPSPAAVEIALSGEERELLEAWTRRRKTANSLAMRSRIVLAAAVVRATGRSLIDSEFTAIR